MISAVFVRRPRLAIVIAVVITIAGVIAITRIPVAQFPDIVPPQRAGDRQLSRRVGRGRRGHRRPAARGADRRRRQDDLHEVDERQRRQLQPDRQLPARQQPRHRHRQRQQSRADGDGAAPAGGAAAGPDRAEAIGRRAAVHDALQRRPQADAAVHHQLRDDQHPRRNLARRGRWPGAAVRQAQLFHAHLVRHPAAHQPEPVALRRHQRHSGAERPGAGRPDRRPPGERRPAVPDERADAGAADDAGAVRRHRAARQSRRLGAACARRRAGRDGRAERRRRHAPQRSRRRRHRRST